MVHNLGHGDASHLALVADGGGASYVTSVQRLPKTTKDYHRHRHTVNVGLRSSVYARIQADTCMPYEPASGS